MRIAAVALAALCIAAVGPGFTRAAGAREQAVAGIGDVVAAAEKYLVEFDRDSQALFAEERSQQTDNRFNTKQETRALRSNVLMFRDGAEPIWFRDVIEVNGSKVADPDRLMALVIASAAPPGDPASMPVVTPMQIVTESTRQQYGGGFRTVNQPGAALGYLRAGKPADLTFKSEGSKTLDGTKVVLLTLKDAPGAHVVPFAVSGVQGRFWIDPVSGRVLQTELEFIMAAVYRTKITVRYGLDKTLNIVVPILMTDEYENRVELVTGRAEYRNFRKVKIDPAMFAIAR
ncbi:MAG TPA: hypothetical protein VFV78_08290 [Vicinamibacterales bacterium]|nr:hypothetical protein [Vicinamibacterales bacterium]